MAAHRVHINKVHSILAKHEIARSVTTKTKGAGWKEVSPGYTIQRLKSGALLVTFEPGNDAKADRTPETHNKAIQAIETVLKKEKAGMIVNRITDNDKHVLVIEGDSEPVKEPTASIKPWDLKIGASYELSRGMYKGRVCTIKGYDYGKGLALVRLPNGRDIRVRLASLRPLYTDGMAETAAMLESRAVSSPEGEVIAIKIGTKSLIRRLRNVAPNLLNAETALEAASILEDVVALLDTIFSPPQEATKEESNA